MIPDTPWPTVTWTGCTNQPIGGSTVWRTALLGDAERARDTSQEVYLRWLRARREGTRIDNPVGWLLQVAVNLCRSQRRREGTAERHHDRLRADALRAEQSTVETPEEELLRKERARRFYNGLHKLGERDRLLILLRHEQLPYAEIGRILEIQKTSVGSMLARAIAKLTKILEENP